MINHFQTKIHWVGYRRGVEPDDHALRNHRFDTTTKF
jgi:hypothetical protein